MESPIFYFKEVINYKKCELDDIYPWNIFRYNVHLTNINTASHDCNDLQQQFSYYVEFKVNKNKSHKNGINHNCIFFILKCNVGI